MLRADAAQQHLALCNGAAAEIGDRDDAVRDNPVPAAVQMFHTLDGDRAVGQDANPGPASVEEACQVDDLRLPGRVADHRLSPGHAGCQHDVLGGADAWEGQGDLRSIKSIRHAAGKVSAVLLNLHAQLFQRGQVQVNGARAQLTAAWIGDFCLFAPGDDRPQKDDGGAHLPHQRVRDVPDKGTFCLDRKDPAPAAVALPPGFAAQMPQNVLRGTDIRQVGAIFNFAFIAQQGCRQDGQRRVFGAVHPDLSLQLVHAVHYVPICIHRFTRPFHRFLLDSEFDHRLRCGLYKAILCFPGGFGPFRIDLPGRSGRFSFFILQIAAGASVLHRCARLRRSSQASERFVPAAAGAAGRGQAPRRRRTAFRRSGPSPQSAARPRF